MSCSVVDQIYLVLKLQGWIPDPNWSFRRKLAHGIYGVVLFVVMLAPVTIQLERLPRLIKNKEADTLFFTLIVIPAQLTVSSYVLALIFLKPRVEDFRKTLQETEKIAFKYAPKPVIKKYNEECHHALIGLQIIMFASMVVISAWALIPILHLKLDPTMNYENVPLIMTDFNYGLNKTTCFWYIYAFECFEMFQIIINFVIGYFTTIAFCILVKAQFSLLIRSIESAQDVFSEAGRHGASGSDIELATLKVPNVNRSNKRITDEFKLTTYIIHHQHIFRLMNKIRSMLKSVLCICVLHLTVVSANCVVVTTTKGPVLRKIFAGPSSLLFLTYFAILLWFLNELRAACLKVGFMFYSIALGVNQPALRRECLLIMLCSNRRQKFPCFVTSSLTFTFFYKALRMIWNYSSLAESMAYKSV